MNDLVMRLLILVVVSKRNLLLAGAEISDDIFLHSYFNPFSRRVYSIFILLLI
jgi:hypothetical protein